MARVLEVAAQLSYLSITILQSSQKQLPENIARALYDN